MIGARSMERRIPETDERKRKKQSVGVSLIYKFSERIGVKGIGLVIGIILARLLEPEVFGLVAIITAVTAIAQTFVDSGLGVALIQNQNTDEADYSTVFYISFAIAAALYAALFFLAPLFAAYYEMDELTQPFRVLTLTLMFHSFSAIQTAKLTREMRFRSMFLCNLIVTLLTGALGIGLAYAGAGLWALVAYYLSNAALICVAYAFAARWRPRLCFSVSRAKELFGYGYKILISGLLCSIFTHLRTFIIGKQYSTAELAYYNRGEQIPGILSTAIDNSFNAVMLPTYSRAQDDQSMVRALLRRTVALNTFISFPFMFGLAVVGEPLVRFLYTEKWLFCVPYLQILSLAGLAVSITSPCLVSIKALGRSDIYMKLEFVRRAVMLAVLLVSLCFHSLRAIALGWLVSSMIDIVIVMFPVRRLVGYRGRELLRDVLPTLLLSAVMSAAVYGIGRLAPSTFGMLLVQIAAGGLIYFGLAWLCRLESLNYLLHKIKALIGRKTDENLEG